MKHKPEVLLLKFVVLVFHMPNYFDYFDCRLGTVLFAAVVVVVVRLELLYDDYYHLRMDCTLLKCSIVGRHGQPVEQLDPIKQVKIYISKHY